MAELYVMQKYLQPQALRERGIFHFDDWAANFGETVTEMEMAPEATAFVPAHALLSSTICGADAHVREIADIQTADMLNLPVPKLAGGKPVVVKCKPSKALEEFMLDGLARVERIRNGDVHPTEDNMLKFTTDAKKAGLDMRLIDPDAPADPDGKIAKMCGARAPSLPRKHQSSAVCSSFSAIPHPEKRRVRCLS
jgi:N12 class adenine-specific DNA methylase